MKILLSIKLSLFILLGLVCGIEQEKQLVPEEEETIIMLEDIESEVNIVPIIETTQASQPETKPVETKVQPKPQPVYFKAYRIHGVTPPLEWQKALYDELNRRGVAWYMPYAVCQIWQESRWNQWADNGRGDKGITQQKAIYWAARASHYGVSGADIWNVYAQLRVFAGMMSEFLYSYGGNVESALSLYFYGTGDYAPEYVAHVKSHLSYLEQIK